MSRIFAFSAILGFLFLAACGNGTTGPSELSDWVPLTVNNWWLTYTAGSFVNTNGDTVATWTGTFDTRITDVVQHTGGFSVYKERVWTNITTLTPDTTYNYADTLYSYFQRTDEELRCYDDTVTTEYDIWLKYPVTLGETWMKSDSSQAELEVTSLSTTVTVPAGTFDNCIVVRETLQVGSSTSVTNHYYHRGVGQVQNVISSETMLGTIKLTGYNIL